jgi:putative membrane protein
MKNKFKEMILVILKGIGMGAANVIPGVSGGTIALITGIFERLINSLKSLDSTAVKLFFKGKIKELIEYIDFYFLAAIFVGMLISVFSLARLFEYLFNNYPVYIWSYFFGLILASVYFVGKTIEKWKISVIITFIIGTVIAVLLSLLNPAVENDSFLYLIICGVVAICSMILPGLSGSFILVLMGNYELVMIHAINDLNLKIIIPVGIGAIVGLIAFSHFLSWILKKYKDQTIAVLTGFILGSLSVIWPWKNTIYKTNAAGEFVLKGAEKIVQGYKLYIPDNLNDQVLFAALYMVSGIVTIIVVEKLATHKNIEK